MGKRLRPNYRKRGAKAAFRSGFAFELQGRLFAEWGATRDDRGQPPLSVRWWMASSVVQAFALESYLKALHLVADGKQPGGHVLRDLFDALEAKPRGAPIARRIRELADEAFTESQKAKDWLALGNDAMTFDAALDACSLVFEDWRYRWEHDAEAKNQKMKRKFKLRRRTGWIGGPELLEVVLCVLLEKRRKWKSIPPPDWNAEIARACR